MMTASTSLISIPARFSATSDAALDIAITVSSFDANRRDWIPERSRIHSSLESIRSTISELGTTRDGR